MINLPETSSTVAPICVSWLKGSAYVPLFTFKERNSSLFCPIFLKLTFDNFTSPVGLAILKFYMPSLNFTSLGHRACTIFRRLLYCAGLNDHQVTSTFVKLCTLISSLRLTCPKIVIEVMCTHFIYCLCNLMLFQLVHFLQNVQGSKIKWTSNFQPSAIMSRVD